jgi:hypothetical protein
MISLPFFSLRAMDITTFPNDIFLIIISYLSPSDIILNRSISKSFHAAFTEPKLCRYVLQQHYPRVRELRHTGDGEPTNWSHILAKVTARYHYLQAGKPRSIQKLALGKSFVVPKWARYYPVAKWAQHLQFEEKTAPFHYPDTMWTYEDGLLVFPSAKLQKYVLYDLCTGFTGNITHETEGKIMRRMNLKDRVLIVEWCEGDAYHQLNENELVYRHFATAYDLVQDPRTQGWSTVFRSIYLLLLT